MMPVRSTRAPAVGTPMITMPVTATAPPSQVVARTRSPRNRWAPTATISGAVPTVSAAVPASTIVSARFSNTL